MLQTRNLAVVERSEVPRLGAEEWATALRREIGNGGRVVALLALPAAGSPHPELLAVVARDAESSLHLASVLADRQELGSLAAELPQLALFERELAEQEGLVFAGHPRPEPLRRSRGGPPAESTRFHRVAGSEIHEVAVGPVHAGVIEPGHFRFQCHGETVLELEIALGYQHRGVESVLREGSARRRIHVVETLCGDSTVAHTMAYCEGIEALARTSAPPRGQALRAIALELERLANHTGDLGALAGDVGFLPTASFCGRLRGDWLGLTAELCGSRFGRGLVRPGGTAFDLDPEQIELWVERLDRTLEETRASVDLLWSSPSVMVRFEGNGVLSKQVARALGMVGPPARAAGLERDVRVDHPSGLYRFAQLPPASWHTGDVHARAWVRWREIEHSAAFVHEQLLALPEGACSAGMDADLSLAPGLLCVSLVEGWRGEVCHVLFTDDAGTARHAKVVDASFHNWPGLELAMRGQQISDFPLCNKSFNLSYCGFDL